MDQARFNRNMAILGHVDLLMSERKEQEVASYLKKHWKELDEDARDIMMGTLPLPIRNVIMMHDFRQITERN